MAGELEQLVKKNRSYRRFFEEEKIEWDTLTELIDISRFIPSGGNIQALRYLISNEAAMNAKIFETLGWAGYLKDWDGPIKGERPSAYIVMLTDLALGKGRKHDEGIAAQTIMLAAVERGYGGCILGNINRAKLAEYLDIDMEKYELDLVLALGKPKEVVVTEIVRDNDIKYYRDGAQVHHVPKRELKDIILS